MKPKYLLIGLLLAGSMQMQAQERKPWVLRALNAVKTYIDSSAVKGIDKHYLEVPQKPWALVLKYNANDMDLKYTARMSQEQMQAHGVVGELNLGSQFQPRREVSLGAWIGYRGYGLGYSYSLQRSKGSNFSIGATGANYGVNLRIRSFNTNELYANIWGWDNQESINEEYEAETWEDIKIKTAIFDGFYMLNGKRFSYAAAYDQSMNQIRSAGSLMIGVMWFQTSIDNSKRLNALLVQALGDVGRIKIQEGSIGVGYAYNWVPAKNLLLNITAMPMLTVYNRTRLTYYESNYDIFLESGKVSPTGKKEVPDDNSWTEDITITETGEESEYGKPSLNFDARASATYQFGRYFVTVCGQLNHYNNTVDNQKLRLTDWYVNAAIGIRL